MCDWGADATEKPSNATCLVLQVDLLAFAAMPSNPLAKPCKARCILGSDGSIEIVVVYVQRRGFAMVSEMHVP